MRHGARTKAIVAAPALLLAIVSFGACNSSPTQPRPPTVGSMAAASFGYTAATAVDPTVDYDSCSPDGVVFTTHLHFIWNSWGDRRYMHVSGPMLFEYDDEIPANQDLRVALHDPNTCLLGDVYVAPTSLTVNGVLLTTVTPVRDGTGLAFRISADGTVSP